MEQRGRAHSGHGARKALALVLEISERHSNMPGTAEYPAGPLLPGGQGQYATFKPLHVVDLRDGRWDVEAVGIRVSLCAH